MKKILILFGMLLGIIQFSSAQNIKTIHGLTLGDSRESLESHISANSDWEVVVQDSVLTSYDTHNRTNLHLIFADGILDRVLATYPPEQRKYQIDNVNIQYGVMEGEKDEDGTTLYYWEFEKWGVVLAVKPDDSTSLFYMVKK